MIGERTGKVFRIGDQVEIRVVQVNVEESSIDFELTGMKARPKREAKSRPKVIDGGKRKPRSNKTGRQPLKTSGAKDKSDSSSGGRKKKKKPFYENAPGAKRKKGKRKKK